MLKKKRLRELIPKPQSIFVKVKCVDCGNEQITYNKPSLPIHCNVCSAVLAEPTGGKAVFKGTIIAEME